MYINYKAYSDEILEAFNAWCEYGHQYELVYISVSHGLCMVAYDVYETEPSIVI